MKQFHHEASSDHESFQNDFIWWFYHHETEWRMNERFFCFFSSKDDSKENLFQTEVKVEFKRCEKVHWNCIFLFYARIKLKVFWWKIFLDFDFGSVNGDPFFMVKIVCKTVWCLVKLFYLFYSLFIILIIITIHPRNAQSQ